MGKKVSQKSIIFETVYNRKKKLNANGEASIEIRIYQNRKRAFITTKIFVSPQQWDNRRKRIKSNHPQFDTLNSQIQNMIGVYEKLQYNKLSGGQTFSLEDFKKATDIDLSNQSFLVFMEDQIKINSNNNKEKTKTSHTNVLNHLKKYKKDKDILFSDINYEFVEGFLNFLRSESKAHNTVHKQFKILKSYINIAIEKKKIMAENPCKRFRISEKPCDRDVLSYEELMKIESLEMDKYPKDLAIVRDMFLFACYTGLRISDVMKLKKENLKNNNKNWVFEFRSKKEEKKVDLDLHMLFKKKKSKKSRPELILDKYYDKKENFVFPRMVDSKINRELKVIAELAKVDIKLTFSVGRHTFGTYMATKVSVALVMTMMQHSDIRTTMRYVHIGREMMQKGLLDVTWS